MWFIYKLNERNLTEELYFYFCSMFVTSCKRLRIMKGTEARGVWETKKLVWKVFWCEGKKKTNNLSACVFGRTNEFLNHCGVCYAMCYHEHAYLKLCSKEGKWKIQCSFLVSSNISIRGGMLLFPLFFFLHVSNERSQRDLLKWKGIEKGDILV